MTSMNLKYSESIEESLLAITRRYLSLHVPHLDVTDSAVVCSRALYEQSSPFTSLLLPASQPPPVVYVDSSRGIVAAFFSLGQHLAGHPGILHGGASVTLLDEAMGRAALERLPSHKIAVTASIELKYKAPIYLGSGDKSHTENHTAGTFIAVYAEVNHASGRKAEVTGYIADVETGQKLVEGTGVFVEPRDLK